MVLGIIFLFLFGQLYRLPSVEATTGWLGSWRYRIPLTIDAGDVDADLANFTVLIHLSASSGITGANVTNIFTILGSSYLKIAVTLDDGTTQCYVEIESWNSTSKVAWLWTKVSTIDDALNTVLYLYYDSVQLNNSAYVGLPNSAVAENVWDASFVFVSHMLDDPDTSHIRDSTGNDNDGTKTAANQPVVSTSGKISDAQSFDGLNDEITINDANTLDFSTAVTISFWLNLLANPTDWSRTINKGDTAYLFQEAGGSFRFSIYVDGAIRDSNLIVYTAGVLAFWECVYDSSTHILSVYKNGVASNKILNGLGSYLIGINNVNVMFDQYSVMHQNIILDEVHFSNIARSAAWVLADYESGRDHFATFGSIETNYCYLTVYFQSGITLLVNGTSKANATQIEFTKTQNANLTSILTSSYTFFKYSYGSASSLSNPLTLGLSANTTVWAYRIPSEGEMKSFVFAAALIALFIFAPMLLLFISMRRR